MFIGLIEARKKTLENEFIIEVKLHLMNNLPLMSDIRRT